MAKKRKNLILNSNNADESSFEIDLAPMLALMVTLIPIMLLSTAFVKINLIETPLPQVVQKAMEQERNKKEKVYSVTLEMNDKGFSFQLLLDGKVQQTTRLPKINKEWDFDGLYKVAHKTKMAHPGVFKIDFRPASHVKYKEMVSVMDAVRRVKQGDQKAVVTDKETLQKAQTDIMFPDINFANVVEG